MAPFSTRALSTGSERDGKLVTTPARGGNPETVGFLRQLPWAEVLSLLKADPRGYSLVQYDREELHHSPMLYKAPVVEPPAVEPPVAEPPVI